MANKAKAETATPVIAENKYTIEKLRANCLTLFGVTSSTFDGATHGLNDEYSVEEIKKIIEKWNKKEAK